MFWSSFMNLLFWYGLQRFLFSVDMVFCSDCFVDECWFKYEYNEIIECYKWVSFEMNEFTNLSAETAASVTTDQPYGHWVNRTFGDVQAYLSSIFLNHHYFQLANIFFLLSYFAPNCKCGFIYLRFMCLIGCVFFAVWGLEIQHWKDVLASVSYTHLTLPTIYSV